MLTYGNGSGCMPLAVRIDFQCLRSLGSYARRLSAPYHDAFGHISNVEFLQLSNRNRIGEHKHTHPRKKDEKKRKLERLRRIQGKRLDSLFVDTPNLCVTTCRCRSLGPSSVYIAYFQAHNMRMSTCTRISSHAHLSV